MRTLCDSLTRPGDKPDHRGDTYAEQCAHVPDDRTRAVELARTHAQSVVASRVARYAAANAAGVPIRRYFPWWCRRLPQTSARRAADVGGLMNFVRAPARRQLAPGGLMRRDARRPELDVETDPDI